MGRRGGHEGAALSAAAVLHLLLLGVAPRFIPPSAVVGGPALPVTATELEIEIAAPPADPPRAPEPPPPPEADVEDPPSAPPAARVASRPAVAAAPRIAEPAPPAEPAPAEPAPAEPVPAEPAPAEHAAAAPPATPALPPAAQPPAPAPSDGYSQPPAAAPVTGLPPGIGGAPVWALPGVIGPVAVSGPVAAPTAAAPSRPVDKDVAGQVLRGTLAKKDHELGLALPAAGVVASTLADAVRASAAPGDSRATFEVEIGANGKVRDVRLVSSSAGNAGTWQRVTREATSALGAKALAMTGDASNGATVIVKVESKEQYAAGNKKKVDVRPVCANQVIEDVANALQPLVAGPGSGIDPDAAAAAAAPRQPGAIGGRAADDEERRRFCIPIGVAGVGDVSNIGTHLQKVVRSTYQVVLPGAKKIQADEARPVDVRAPWLEKREDTSDRVFKKWKKPPKKKKKKKPGEVETAR